MACAQRRIHGTWRENRVLVRKGSLFGIYAPGCETQQRERNAREDSVRTFFCFTRSSRILLHVLYSSFSIARLTVFRHICKYKSKEREGGDEMLVLLLFIISGVLQLWGHVLGGLRKGREIVVF